MQAQGAAGSSRRAAASLASASEAVRPGLSMPYRHSRPGTPCVRGPASSKSAAGWPGPATCRHTAGLGRRAGAVLEPRQQHAEARCCPPPTTGLPRTHLWPHARIGWLQRALGQARQVALDGGVKGCRPCGVYTVVNGTGVGAWGQPARLAGGVAEGGGGRCRHQGVLQAGGRHGSELQLLDPPTPASLPPSRPSPRTTRHQAQTARLPLGPK